MIIKFCEAIYATNFQGDVIEIMYSTESEKKYCTPFEGDKSKYEKIELFLNRERKTFIVVAYPRDAQKYLTKWIDDPMVLSSQPLPMEKLKEIIPGHEKTENIKEKSIASFDLIIQNKKEREEFLRNIEKLFGICEGSKKIKPKVVDQKNFTIKPHNKKTCIAIIMPKGESEREKTISIYTKNSPKKTIEEKGEQSSYYLIQKINCSWIVRWIEAKSMESKIVDGSNILFLKDNPNVFELKISNKSELGKIINKTYVNENDKIEFRLQNKNNKKSFQLFASEEESNSDSLNKNDVTQNALENIKSMVINYKDVNLTSKKLAKNMHGNPLTVDDFWRIWEKGIVVTKKVSCCGIVSYEEEEEEKEIINIEMN